MTPSSGVLNHYFSLSNTAGQDERDFTELVQLFAPDASFTSGRGERSTGIDKT